MYTDKEIKMLKEIDEVVQELDDCCTNPGKDIVIIVGGKTLRTYDHAFLVQELMSTLNRFKEEL
jgi:dihydrofolate reductase